MGFEIYKKGQGKYTRLWTGLMLGAICGLGCMQLYHKLDATDYSMWVKTLIPAVLFVGLAFLIFLLVNKHNVADFMIASEGELKKVSWSSRQEITTSTIIVIVVVVLMAALLGATDLGFKLLFDKLIS